MSILISQFIPPPPHSPWYLYVSSLHLCLYFCFSNKIIYAIFLIPCLCVYIWYLFFSFWLTSLFMIISAAVRTLQSCPTLCDPIDSSPPGSPVPGILQARTLEWVAISFFNAWKWKVKVNSLSRVQLLATPWTAAYQAPPSMGFSRQEYWSGVPLPSPMIISRPIHISANDQSFIPFYG